MKSKILLSLLLGTGISVVAQKEQRLTAYAITAPEKGSSGWNEVRLIDLNTGEEVQKVFSVTDQPRRLNARTGKEIAKKDQLTTAQPQSEIITYRTVNNNNPGTAESRAYTVLVNRRAMHRYAPVQSDLPFATNSAACAYDKKHDRLYYTPMGINQLRYIDLKAKTPSVYYFEDEAFGVVSGPWDVRNQITRMVIAADGIGYALSNSANHLLRFTTNKKAEITDLGELVDDEANGNNSIRNGHSHGGDMIADDRGDLYVITANRAVYKIDVSAMRATYKGTISGLPRGYSTNGAMVEKGTMVIVSSASSTDGYYRFDLNTLQAEKLATEGTVFNASDLAGSALVSEKTTKPSEVPLVQRNAAVQEAFGVYPNPANAGGIVKLSFTNQPGGRYTIQLLDASGQVLDSRQIALAGKVQLQDYRLPALLAKGNYLVKVIGEDKKVVGINTIIVQ